MTPEQLKASILQYAIQGKLVESDTDDLPVDLSAIKQKRTDDYEFKLPDNWQLTHLESITNNIPVKQYQILESNVLTDGRFPVISQSKAYSIGFSNDTDKVYHHDRPVIIFGDHTTEVKFVEFDFVVGADGVKVFEPNYEIVVDKFLFYIFQFYSRGLSKIGGYSRHYKYIKNKPIPLPPLAEQHRIVAKIEELLPLVDRYTVAYEKLEQLNAKFPEGLKKSILQYAIQGKLVEQCSEEGAGEELYQQIQAEKQKLIKEGKIKKEKPLPEIADDDKPFDIPESWKWVRLGDIFNLIMGQSPNGQSVSESSDGIEFHQGKVYFGENYINKSPQTTNTPTKIAEPNSVLLCVRAPVGIVNITDRKLCIGRGLCDVIPLGGMDEVFTLNWLRCLEDTFIKKATGTTFIAITADTVKNQVMPLPPLAEQKRIVAKIEELLPLCERLK